MVEVLPYRSSRGTWLLLADENRCGRQHGLYLLECESLWVWRTKDDPEVHERSRFPVERRIPFW
jgi:hypothetical protein